MTGETVTISIPGEPTVNEMGEETQSDPTVVTVGDAIVGPSVQQDSQDKQRPYGTQSGYLLYLPRTWKWRSLRGATVTLSGSQTRWRVVGDPRPVITDLTPTGYWPVAIQITGEEG